MYQNIYSIGRSDQTNYVFHLSGDHIYKMNYGKMLQQHVDAGADVTVATIEMTLAEAAGRFGVIETDDQWRVLGFEEKPANPKASRCIGTVNASMGVYIFNTQLLIPILMRMRKIPSPHTTSGRTSCRRSLAKYRVFAYNFIDENRGGPLYWRDVGTVDAYYEANMDRGGDAGVQSVRPELAAAHLAASVSGQRNCVCRSGPHGHGAGFGGSAASILSGGRVKRWCWG